MQIDEILRKLRYKNEKALIINAPLNIEDEFKKSGFSTNIKPNSKFAILFIYNKNDAEKYIKSSIEKIEYDSNIWIAYPKSTSSIKTDINRYKLWTFLKPYGYKLSSIMALDKDWSAMRIKPIEKVEPN